MPRACVESVESSERILSETEIEIEKEGSSERERERARERETDRERESESLLRVSAQWPQRFFFFFFFFFFLVFGFWPRSENPAVYRLMQDHPKKAGVFYRYPSRFAQFEK